MAGKSDAPISVVIPNHNGAAYLRPCLQSLLAQTCRAAEIIVVDNGSSDASVEVALNSAPEARVIRLRSNLGFAGAANAGVHAARSEWVALLNNDTEAAPDWLEECAEAVKRHPDAAFVACRVHDAGRRAALYSAGDVFLRAGIGYRLGQEQAFRPDHAEEREVFSPCGCAALYRRAVFEDLGGFDERLFAYLEDVELGIRLQAAGHHGFYAPRAVVYHVGGGTSGGEFSDLAVQLRTRNAVFLLLVSLPRRLVLRWLPMILLSQAFWLGRVLSHGGISSYLRGLAAVVPMIRLPARGSATPEPPFSVPRLREAVLRSESQARADVARAGEVVSSTFLKWYFRLF